MASRKRVAPPPVNLPPQPPVADRIEAGRALRESIPIECHAEVGMPAARDALAVLAAQDVRRVQELVPIRYGRMSATPFTFYRGAAAVMAADLAAAPSSGLQVQLCGDAHLSNFGAFSAPDRRLVFDLNDFDETLPGPFEWDIKRLAASLVIAARNNGLGKAEAREVVSSSMAMYRSSIAEAAAMDPLDLWYYRVEVDALAAMATRKDVSKQLAGLQTQATRKNRLGALGKLTEIVDGKRRIVDRPPLVRRFRADELAAELERLREFAVGYRESLGSDRLTLLERYRITDVAIKVVGVGSVGTLCLIALLESPDGHPMFLQFKEATASVLEEHLGTSSRKNSGERVVAGQQLTQSAVDVFLGWSRYHGALGDRDFYARQLWDGKASVVVEDLGLKPLIRYGRLCAAVLARAHARSGDPAMISGYVGRRKDSAFDEAITQFSMEYAKRNEADHTALLTSISEGRTEVIRDI